MADKEVKLTLKVDAQDALKATNEQTGAMTKLEKAHQSYKDTLGAEGQEIRKVNQSKQSLKKQQDLEAQAANSATGSYQQLSAQYRLNVIQLNAMGEAERKTSEKGKKLTAETLNIRTAMAEAKKETGDNTLNVGNYTDSVKNALAQTGMFGKLLAFQTKAQAAYAAAQKATTTATNSGTKATKIFGLALTATGIGAIVVVLGLLIGAILKTTQRGQDVINKFLSPLKGAFEAIKGVIQDIALNVFDQLTARFDILVNRVSIGIATLRLKWNQLTGDTEEAAEIQKTIEDRTNNIAKAQEKLNKLANENLNVWERIKGGAETQTKIFELGKKIEEQEIGLAKRKALINDRLREQQTISKNINLSNEERLRATNETIKASQELAEEDNKILDMRIEKMKLSLSLNDTDRIAAKELADLEAERINRDAAQKMQAIKFISRKNSLEAKAEKERIAGIKAISDAEEAVLMKKAEDEAKELERIKAFDEAKKQLENDLAIEAAESDQEKEELKAEQDAEKKELELENMILDAEEKAELEALLLEQKENKLAEIRDKWGDKKLKDQEATDAKEIKAKTKMSKIQSAIAAKLASTLQGILGDSLAGQIAGIAVDAAIQSASVSIKSKAAQASNLAIASSIGPPQNLVTIPIAKGQNVGMAASSASAISGIWASAGAAAAGTALKSIKFQTGGFISGPSHMNGGVNAGNGMEWEGNEYLSSVKTMQNPQLSGIVQAANEAGNKGENLNVGVTEERVAEIASEVVRAVPVYIVESEMTDAQRIVQVRESEFNG